MEHGLTIARAALDGDLSPAAASSRLKRGFDVIAAVVTLTILLPLLIVTAAAIVVDSGWGPLFPQIRVGRGEKQFRLWKFRTMVNGAHDRRADLLHMNEAPFPAFKIRSDPRMTRLGRFLRRSSLDELPQLWNVIRGEMSIVGPRPPLAEEVAHYDGRGLRRLTVRPGLTCTWQIGNRSAARISFDDWVQMDIDYIDRWSFAGDLSILRKTAAVIVRMSGS